MWSRITDAVRTFFTAPPTPPPPAGPFEGGATDEPPARRLRDEERFWQPVPPEESGIPPEPGSGTWSYREESNTYERDAGSWDAYGDMLDTNNISDDPFAAEALWVGWFDTDASSDERSDARETFFDYMGWEDWEFDWENWREYMGYGDEAA